LDIPDLTGPFKLTNSNVSIHIRGGTLGVYVLGPLGADGYLAVKFTGRSDADLAGGLRQHADKHDAFGFARAGSSQQAFEMECRLFTISSRWITQPTPLDRPRAMGNARSAKLSTARQGEHD
jgi:hypothetical protein